jgi:hypothetical protein
MYQFIKGLLPRRIGALLALAVVCLLAVPSIHAMAVAHVPVALLHMLGGGGAVMGMAFLSANDNAILIQYLDDTYPLTLIQNRPFYDRVTKKSDVGGSSVSLPLNLGFGGGQGGTFETALANAQVGAGVNLAFTIPPAVGYGIAVLQNETVPFTQTRQSAIDQQTLATKAAMELAAQDFTAKIFGSGFGDQATISTATNTSGSIWKLVLTIPTDANKFNINGVLNSKATPASASLDAGSCTVLGTNPLDGSIVVDVGATGMTPTATHVLGIAGTIAASTSVVTFPGIFGWCPPITSRTAGVVGDTFLGVTRNASTSVVATSGWAFDGRGKALAPTINSACGQMANLENSRPKIALMNPITLARLAIERDDKVRYDMESNLSAEMFFMGMDLNTPAGHVEAFGEAACPADKIVLTDPDQWIFGYPDRPFQPSDIQGNVMIPSYDHNRTRAAITCAGFLYPTNPAAVGVISISL